MQSSKLVTSVRYPGYRGKMPKGHFDCTKPFSKGKKMGLLFLGGLVGREIVDLNVDPCGRTFQVVVRTNIGLKSDEPLDRLLGILQDRTFKSCSIYQDPCIREFQCTLQRTPPTSVGVDIDRMFRAYERLYPEHFIFPSSKPRRPYSSVRRPIQHKRKAPSSA